MEIIINNEIKNNEQIIVSVASYKERFNTLKSCYDTIINQSLKADKVILNIEECDYEYLPIEILNDIKNNVIELNLCNDNIKSHNKYFYVMRKYPDSIIITIDDDGLYNYYTIESLYECYKEHKDCIVCLDANNIVIKNDIIRFPYEYKIKNTNFESFKNIAIGWAGVLYPPNILRQDFSLEEINGPFYYDDDLYLKIVETRNDVKVIEAKMIKGGGNNHPEHIEGTWNNKYKLSAINGNDKTRFYYVQKDVVEKIKNAK